MSKRATIALVAIVALLIVLWYLMSRKKQNQPSYTLPDLGIGDGIAEGLAEGSIAAIPGADNQGLWSQLPGLVEQQKTEEILVV